MNPEELLAALEGIQPTEMRSRAAVADALRRRTASLGPSARVVEGTGPSLAPGMTPPENEIRPDYTMPTGWGARKALKDSYRINQGHELSPGVREKMYPLPDRFYDQDHRLAPNINDKSHVIAGGQGQDAMMGGDGSDEFQAIMEAIKQTNPAAQTGEVATKPDEETTTFSPEGSAIANQAMRWLVDNGKISSEDAARAAANLEVPGEIIARIGLGQAFLDQYPEFRANIEAGDATGLIDWASGQLFDSSKSAAIRRRIASGQDAMRRMLTGAALTGSETDEYVARYAPSMTDDAQSLLDKTDQLEREIKYIMGALMIGRGGTEILSDLKERLPPGERGYSNPMPGQEETPVDQDGWKPVGGARVRVKR